MSYTIIYIIGYVITLIGLITYHIKIEKLLIEIIKEEEEEPILIRFIYLFSVNLIALLWFFSLFFCTIAYLLILFKNEKITKTNSETI